MHPSQPRRTPDIRPRHHLKPVALRAVTSILRSLVHNHLHLYPLLDRSNRGHRALLRYARRPLILQLRTVTRIHIPYLPLLLPVRTKQRPRAHLTQMHQEVQVAMGLRMTSMEAL
jgi:hypothetical protein